MSPPVPRTPLSRPEFIALVAMLTAIVAFSIDSMLPALPEIAQALSPEALNQAQLIISTFVLGLGVGTLFTGPLSDALGRKPVVLGGAALYCVGALIAWRAADLRVLLLARLLQGLGGAGPRVVAMAVVRDLYAGREMARVMSLVAMIFVLIPAIAPSLGAVLIAWLGWRQIFLAFIVFAAATSLWLMLRLPETLPPERRSALSWTRQWRSAREALSHPVLRNSVLAQTLILGILYGTLSQIQQLFGTTYGQGESFPIWFGAIALCAGLGSILNARLVTRLGMRLLALWVMRAQVALSALMVGAFVLPLPGSVEFAFFVIWVASVFIQMSLSMGNLTALAMAPMGHIAGMAAALMSSVATIGAAILAAPIGLLFDGTALPLALASCALAAAAAWIIARLPADET